jgi:hypothetical protein
MEDKSTSMVIRTKIYGNKLIYKNRDFPRSQRLTINDLWSQSPNREERNHRRTSNVSRDSRYSVPGPPHFDHPVADTQWTQTRKGTHHLNKSINLIRSNQKTC